MTRPTLERSLAEARLAPSPARLEALVRELERRGCPLVAPVARRVRPRIESLPELRVVEAIVEVMRCRDVVVRLRGEPDGCVAAVCASGVVLTLSPGDAPGAWDIVVCEDETGELVWYLSQGASLSAAIEALSGQLGRLPVWRGLERRMRVDGPRPQPTAEVVRRLSSVGLDAPERLIDALRRGCLSVLPTEPLSEREQRAGQMLDALVALAAGDCELLRIEGEDYEAELHLSDGRRLVACVDYQGGIDEIYGLLGVDEGDDGGFYLDGSAAVTSAPIEWTCLQVSHVLAAVGAWEACLDGLDRDGAVDEVDSPAPQPPVSRVEPAPQPVRQVPASPAGIDLAVLRERGVSSSMRGAPTTGGRLLAVYWLMIAFVAMAVGVLSAGGSGSSSAYGYQQVPRIEIPHIEPLPPLDLGIYDEGQVAMMQARLALHGGIIDDQGRIVWFRPPAEALVGGAVAGASAAAGVR